jgi:large subunit ribosomal protein L22
MSEKKSQKEFVTAKSVSKFNIISPYKVRKVINKLRGLPYEKAVALSDVIPNKAAKIAGKTIKSAFYSLEAANDNIDADKVFVKEIFASAGPILKRIIPRARGRADRKKKRTTHLTVVVGSEMGDSK